MIWQKKQTPDAALEKAIKLANKGDLGGAVSTLDQAIKLDDKVSSLWKLKCQLLFGMGQPETAIDILKRYLELEPQDAAAFSVLGSSLKELGRFEEAERAHKTATEVEPDNTNCWYNLGVLYEIVDMDKAKIAYEQAVSCDFDNAEAWYNMGNVLKALGDDVGAVTAVKNSLKSNPDDPDAWDNLALFLCDLGQFVEAESAVRKALEIDPHHPNAVGRLGSILLQRGDTEGAKRQFQKSTSLNPSSPIDFYNLALVNDVTGDKVDAARAYLIAQELGVSELRPAVKKIRTTNCGKYNHPEFLIYYEEPPLNEELVKWLVDHFENDVASGAVYKEGETVQIGWMIGEIHKEGEDLVLCEPHFLDMPIQWRNSVNRTVLHLFSQNFVGESVGLNEASEFPTIFHTAIVCHRFGEQPFAFLLDRSEPSINNPNDSGWAILCDYADCDHNSPESLRLASLYECATMNGHIIKYLALPSGSTVHETGNPDDFKIVYKNRLFEPKPDSYLAEKLSRAKPIS